MSINNIITAPCEDVSFLHGLGNKPSLIGAYLFDMKRTKFYCQCGCGEEVSIFRGKPRKFKQGHALRTPTLKKFHSDRMKGNQLFKGGTMPESAKAAIAKSQTGSGNSVWKGGRTISAGGYVTILVPDHPYADVNGRVKEERLMLEKHLGRHLLPGEVVHHINHDSLDNRLENFALMTISNHSKYHSLIRWHSDTNIDYKKFSIASGFTS